MVWVRERSRLWLQVIYGSVRRSRNAAGDGGDLTLRLGTAVAKSSCIPLGITRRFLFGTRGCKPLNSGLRTLRYQRNLCELDRLRTHENVNRTAGEKAKTRPRSNRLVNDFPWMGVWISFGTSIRSVVFSPLNLSILKRSAHGKKLSHFDLNIDGSTKTISYDHWTGFRCLLQNSDTFSQ